MDRHRKLRRDGAQGRRLPQLSVDQAPGEDRGTAARPRVAARPVGARTGGARRWAARPRREPGRQQKWRVHQSGGPAYQRLLRSEEHTSELQSLMRISYAVFCLKKKKQNKNIIYTTSRTQCKN